MKIVNKIIVNNLPPKEVNVLWNDTSEDKNGVLKQFVDGEWRKLKAIAQDNSIETNMIKDDQITTSKIKDSQITSAKIKDGEVKSGDIASNAVITAKIKDANVTYQKLASDVKNKLFNKIIIDCTDPEFSQNEFYQFDFANGTEQEIIEGFQQLVNDVIAGDSIFIFKTGDGIYIPQVMDGGTLCQYVDPLYDGGRMKVHVFGYMLVENDDFDDELQEGGDNIPFVLQWVNKNYDYSMTPYEEES